MEGSGNQILSKQQGFFIVLLTLILVGCLAQGSYPALVLGVTTDKDLVVIDVHAGGAADLAGLQTQDKLLALNGIALSTPEMWWLKLSEFEVGETYAVTVERAGEALTKTVTAARPSINWAPGTTPTAFPTDQYSLR